MQILEYKLPDGWLLFVFWRVVCMITFNLQGCGHGGHVLHLQRWMKEHKSCPAGCGHKCQYNWLPDITGCERCWDGRIVLKWHLICKLPLIVTISQFMIHVTRLLWCISTHRRNWAYKLQMYCGCRTKSRNILGAHKTERFLYSAHGLSSIFKFSLYVLLGTQSQL